MQSAKPPLKQSSPIDDPVYLEFIAENQALLEEISQLKHEIKILRWDLNQYQNLSVKICALVKARENFGVRG